MVGPRCLRCGGAHMSDANMRWAVWSPLPIAAPPIEEADEEEEEAAIISGPSASSELLEDMPKALEGVTANAAPAAGLRPHTSPGRHVAEALAAAAIMRIVALNIVLDAHVKLLVKLRRVRILLRMSEITIRGGRSVGAPVLLEWIRSPLSSWQPWSSPSCGLPAAVRVWFL